MKNIKLNPTLKNIFIRIGCAVASIFVFNKIDWLLEVNTINGGWLEDHTTIHSVLLMMVAALFIRLNIYGCSRTVKRFAFGGFLLGVSALVGLWKCGVLREYFYFAHQHYYWLLRIWGAMSIVLAVVLSLFCRAESLRNIRHSKITLWTAILLFDFVVAMPNVWEYGHIDKYLYTSAKENLYLLKTDYSCVILYGQDSIKPYYADSTAFLSVHYHCIDKAADLWISESGDSLYFERKVNRYKITRPDGESFETGSAPAYFWETATNCWQWNVWWKLKRLFNRENS